MNLGIHFSRDRQRRLTNGAPPKHIADGVRGQAFGVLKGGQGAVLFPNLRLDVLRVVGRFP